MHTKLRREYMAVYSKFRPAFRGDYPYQFDFNIQSLIGINSNMKSSFLFSSVPLVKLRILTLIIFASCSVLCYAQDSISLPQKQSVNPAAVSIVNYFKLEIGMHILDCPVLPMRLKDKLMGINGIKDYNTDMKSQSILFNIPAGVVTKEQILNMAAASGFPAGTVTVVMDSKPFHN